MTDHQYTPETLETRRRRARYRAAHRGTKELDLILGRFADAHLAQFDASHLDMFEAVLDLEETDLQIVLMGLAPVSNGPLKNLVEQIRDFQIECAIAGARAD